MKNINLSVRSLINLKQKLPQVGSFSIPYEFASHKILIESSFHNVWLDYVITEDGSLKIGKGHYKLANKAPRLQMAGEIMVDKTGAVIKINNNSGHYQPSINSFLIFIKRLLNSNILINVKTSIELTNWETTIL